MKDHKEDILVQLQHLALNLIQVTELEKAGVRDGSLLPTRWTEDGHYIWRVNHPLTDLANEIAQVVKDFHERAAEEDREDDHLGLCPVCRKPGVCVNVYKDHWMTCKEHKTRWWAGSNLFSSWLNETVGDWNYNREMLKSYTVVEPFFYPRPEPEKTISTDPAPDLPF